MNTCLLQFRADGGDVMSSWSLATAQLLNRADGMQTTFNCNAWIPRTGATYDVTESSSVLALQSYTIKVVTDGGWAGGLVA